jgi:hypothetical protein
MIKSLNKLSVEGLYLNTTKAIIQSGEKLKAFSLKFRTRQTYPLLPVLFNIVLEAIARTIR